MEAVMSCFKTLTWKEWWIPREALHKCPLSG